MEYAAQGNKDAPTDQLRVEAIQALANYPDDATLQLLEKLAASGSHKAVSVAAQAALAKVRKALTP